MVWRNLGRLLTACGMLLTVFGASALPAQGAEATRPGAAPLMQPSPRPPLAPTPRSHGSSKSEAGAGRITGTIIDQTTGAPARGVKVNIGGVIVISDDNGNYDLWVAAGPYSVALVLSPSEGEPAQGQQMVDVAAGATVILHLNFRGALAPPATPAAADQGQPTPAPVMSPTAHAAGGVQPTTAKPRLPRTGEQSGGAWAWIALGMLLLIGGVGLELGRKRLAPLMAGAAAHAARDMPGYENARLLATLLARGAEPPPARARTVENDLLLAALLTTNNAEGQANAQE